MAFVPLATTTTLQTFRAIVRRRAGVNDPQSYPIPITDRIVNDFIHEAIVRVRRAAHKLVDAEYMTRSSVDSFSESETKSLFNIAALEIYDTKRVTVSHGTQKDIAVISAGQFDTQIKLRSDNSLQNAVFAKIENDPENAALDIVLYRGSNIESISSLSVHYPRNPRKQMNDDGFVDLPERFVPAAISVAVIFTRGMADNQPQETVEDLIQKTLQTELSQYGIEITQTRN